MTIQEAKLALKDGQRVTHTLFEDNEFIYEKDGVIYEEDGNSMTFFWEHRTESYWNTDWSIVQALDIFEKEYLNSIGFETVSDDGQYGKAESIRARGMTILEWNRKGASCTYFGDKLDKNCYFGIRKDGDTRTVFSGYIYDREQLELLIKLTM